MRKTDRATIARIRHMRNLKMSIGLIATRLHISHVTVWNYLLPSQRKIKLEYYGERYHSGERVRYHKRRTPEYSISNVQPTTKLEGFQWNRNEKT